MNLIDLFIIYFTGGAPLAVYYFLQNRHSGKISFFWLKNFLVLLFWMPFAFVLLTQTIQKRTFSGLDFFDTVFFRNGDQNNFAVHQKQIENLLLVGNLNFSIFDFREVVERYVGLTLAFNAGEKSNSEKEIFRVAQNENAALGSICLHRRNRIKLARHQTEARRDFLELVEYLSDSVADTETLEISAFEIVGLLKDEAAQKSLEKMFAEKVQTGKLSNVEYPENDLWKPQERQPLRTETISTRL